MSDTTPEQWADLRCWWFASVHEIADLELQRRTWLDPLNQNPHWSYVEFCCCFPDADQLRDAREKGHLSVREFKLLTGLGAAIDSHEPPAGKSYDHLAILEQPTWLAVVTKAEQVRQQLLALTKDSVERSHLMGEI
jgi:hypothetical protein